MNSNMLGLAITPILAISLAAFADHPGGGGAKLEASLTGAAEVPGPGDPDGTGMIQMRLNPGQGEVCYTLMTMNVEGVNAAHIHVGEEGQAGGIAISLQVDASHDGMTEKCVEGMRSRITAILRNPSGYYVNVHSAGYPAGAVRGQLEGLRDK